MPCSVPGTESTSPVPIVIEHADPDGGSSTLWDTTGIRSACYQHRATSPGAVMRMEVEQPGESDEALLDAAERRSRTKALARAAQRAQAITALERLLERVTRLEQQVSDEDRRFGIPKLVPTGNRDVFNDALYLLAHAGEDTAGLYLPPGGSPESCAGTRSGTDSIQATVLRRHLERALSRFDPAFAATHKK